MDYDVQWWDEDPVNFVLCLASGIHCLHCYLLFAILVFQNDHFGIPVGCGHVGWYPAEAICAGGQGVGADSLSQVVPVVWRARGCECQHYIYVHMHLKVCHSPFLTTTHSPFLTTTHSACLSISLCHFSFSQSTPVRSLT